MKGRLSIAVSLAFACALSLAPFAQADYDPVGSGVTRFTFDRGFLSMLRKNGVRISARAPARLAGGVASFPVSGGKFDPTNATGTVDHQGALLFSAGGRSLPLKALQLKTSRRHAPFSARVGGGQLRLAAVERLSVSRRGFGEKIRSWKLSLSTKLATRLGKKLHLKRVFEGDQALGSAVTTTRPLTVTLAGTGGVSLYLSPGFEAKLRELFVAVTPIFPAEHPGAEFTLPILGGTIAPDAGSGTIETSGALELLQLGGGQVFWAEDWFDLAAKTASPEVDSQPSPPYAGKIGRTPIAALILSAVTSNATKRTVTVGGASLVLGAATAATFNEVFAKPQGKDGVFAAGEALGTVSFTAQGQ
jgi:hypothetical protein